MTPSEIKDYNLLLQIQELCNSAKSWDGPVSFEEIWQECSNQKNNLKYSIGERIISSQSEE